MYSREPRYLTLFPEEKKLNTVGLVFLHPPRLFVTQHVSLVKLHFISVQVNTSFKVRLFSCFHFLQLSILSNYI